LQVSKTKGRMLSLNWKLQLMKTNAKIIRLHCVKEVLNT